MTRTEALETNEFHVNGKCKRSIGPRGGIKQTSEVWRRNGANRTWKRNPARLEIPVKTGFRTCGTLLTEDFDYLHAPENCPLNRAGEVK